MAVVKWGPLVTSMKGRIGGSVVRLNTYGATIYSNNWSKRGYSFQHYENRFINASLASQWRTLSDADKNCWQTVSVNNLGKKLTSNKRPYLGSTRTNR